MKYLLAKHPYTGKAAYFDYNGNIPMSRTMMEEQGLSPESLELYTGYPDGHTLSLSTIRKNDPDLLLIEIDDDEDILIRDEKPTVLDHHLF